MSSSIGCERFDAHADELALGQLDEPLRNELVAHAAHCPQCRSLLDSIGTLTDRLLLAAPQVEPPAGFESRALARLDAGACQAPRRSIGLWWVAAVAGVMLFAGAFAAVQVNGKPAAVTAAIVTATGGEVGSVQLSAEPTPHLLITTATSRPGPGVRYCELQRPDGTWHDVGWWDAADIASGVWSVGIDPTLLDATAMRIISDGDVLATATFD